MTDGVKGPVLFRFVILSAAKNPRERARQGVRPRGSPELPATDGVVRLRVEMRSTDLYAFQFSPE
jgi:hypothetical protein